MNTGTTYDVIVAGAGPAGAMTAYYLAKAGAKVCVVDAKIFPRDKPCGGGIQERASLNIPFAWKHISRGVLQKIQVSFGLTESFLRMAPSPLVYTVLRSEFDDFLLQTARKAGAEVLEGVRVNSIESRTKSITDVKTSSGTLNSRFVVGADGANSVIARSINSRSAYFWQAALFCEVPDECINWGTTDPATMRIDWGTLPSGYGWIFPKKNYVNIGVGCPALIGHALRPYLTKFLNSQNLLKANASEQVHFAGHQLPTLTRRTKLVSKTTLLVGDAAGLVEPLTGDGISNACHSATLAARALLGCLALGETDLTAYERQVRDEIGSELLWSRTLLSWSVAFPKAVYRLFGSSDEVWNSFCRVLRGEESFKTLTEKVLGPLRLIRPMVEFLVEGCERRRLQGFQSAIAAVSSQARP